MNEELVIAQFDRISSAPDAIPRMRRFILELAVRGRLVEQDAREEQSPELRELLAQGHIGTVTQLPRNWVRGKVGRLLNFQYGKALPENALRETGPVSVFGSNGVAGYALDFLTENPAIIIGRKGSAGALNLSNGPSWTKDVAYFVEPPAFFDIKYLYFALQTLDLDRLGKGVKPGLSRGDAYQLTLSVPPFVEQSRIVVKIEELFALCDRLEAARAERDKRLNHLTTASHYHLNNGAGTKAAREHASFYINNLPIITTRPEQIPALREAILNLAVRGHIILQDENDEPVSTLLEGIRLEQQRLITAGVIPKPKVRPSDAGVELAFDPPKSWKSITFGQLCNIVTSGSRGWAEYYAESGPKFIRAQNIRFGKLRLDDLACVTPPKKSEGTRTQVSRGDLLVVITGAGVTNPALLDIELGEAYVSQHVALITPTDTNLSSWLLLCLMAPMGGRAELVKRAYGAGKPGLNLDNIRSLPIPLPPLEEQRRIVTKLAELMTICDRLESQLVASQTENNRLVKSVLHHGLFPFQGDILAQKAV
jgi:type I restriction enzyme S subunit